MPIALACPSCQQKLQFRDHMAGHTARCPNCGNSFATPAASVPAPLVRAESADGEEAGPWYSTFPARYAVLGLWLGVIVVAAGFLLLTGLVLYTSHDNPVFVLMVLGPAASVSAVALISLLFSASCLLLAADARRDLRELRRQAEGREK